MNPMRLARRRPLQLACCCVAVIAPVATAFAPPARLAARPHPATKAFSRAKPPPKMLVDSHAVNHAVDALNSVDGAWLAHVWQGLADATATAGDVAAAAAPKEEGWFEKLVSFIENDIKTLNGFYQGVGIEHAFGWSIITFTVAVKLLLYPLNYVQLMSSEKMQRLQPTLKEIQRVYGRNKDAQQAATTRLYESTQVNPLAGCLPSLAQVPIFIGLYRALTKLAAENIADEPFLWLPSLEGPVFDQGRGIGWLTQGWHDYAPPLGWAATAAYISIPIFLVISQSFSMKLLSPPSDPNDPSMERTSQVMKYLPLMIGWFSLNVPAALGVYWVANNVITTGTTMATKAWFKANPPKLEVPADILDGIALQIDAVSLDRAREEAALDARPDRTPKRSLSRV